jgi:outer membrane receptor protein involved in Fe transport
VDVILGGTPAMYGDAMGGIINLTTKGPSRTFGAGLELETSVEGYGHHRLGFSVQGPLIKGKQAETALLGFFLAGDLTYHKVGALSATGYYTANEEYQKYIEDHPLVPSGVGGGTYQSASFTKKSDLEYSKFSTNTSNYSINLSGNINIRTTETINLTVGGSFVRSQGHDFASSYSFFNTAKNSIYKSGTTRGYVRFTQRFPTAPESTSLIRNFYYSIQADYTRYTSEDGDPDLWDNIFAYGNLGRFITHKTPTYQLGNVSGVAVNGDTTNLHNFTNVLVLNSWDYDTLVDFYASEFNPLLARYTENYLELTKGYGASGYYDNFTNLQLGGALLNGRTPNSIYQMFAVPGTLMSNYGKSVSDQFSVNVNASMTIGKGESSHEIKLGFQYEQRNSSGMSYSTDYWSLMRSLVNSHIAELDMDHPYAVSYDGFVDTVRYHRYYDANAQYVFDANLRKAMNLPINGTEYILIDSYNFNDNSIMFYDENGNMKKGYVNGGLNISMFAPDELTRDGNFYVSYYGYTYDGKKHGWGERPTLDDFFTENVTDENGNNYFTRPVASSQPIYTAGYIQDKFAFKDLIFQIGLRADRFDANQYVLKDPFILYDYYKVGDKRQNGKINIEGVGEVVVPSNIGDDYAIYVNKISDINEIVGYRIDNTWYNADGAEIASPTVLDKGSGISPWIKNPDQQRVDKESFEDYKPTWNFMPRISFSFPISDEALFFAHYDVLTQRPSSSYFISPLTYYYFNDVSGSIANPNLKPMQTVDYELGFTQKLNNTSSFTITAYYREIRNMIQLYRLTGAYPKDYTSYSNLDFGTTKGLTAEYDLRRTKNVRVRANYTLQYANMTGASTTTAAALINAGVPNLRSTFPTGFDRRHMLGLTVDYRFSSGKKYDGPVINREKSGKTPIQVLANAGVAMTVTGGSGAPYTASRTVSSPISGGNNLLEGTYFGSRMPASFKIDLRADKDFYFTLGGNKEGKTGREAYVNVYVNVTNLLNSKNILSVYSATGDPDDDGYLTSSKYQQEIRNQLDPEAFIQMYQIYVNRGSNYSTPRQIKVGASFNF